MKHTDSAVQRHIFRFAQQQASQSGNLPQGIGVPTKPRDIKHLTPQIAGPPGLKVQEDITRKPAEVGGPYGPEASNSKTQIIWDS